MVWNRFCNIFGLFWPGKPQKDKLPVKYLKNKIWGERWDPHGQITFTICDKQSSRLWDTQHLLTDADSSTDTKKILQVRQNWPKKYNFFLCGNFTPLMSKSFPIWDHLFFLLFPKDSENLKSLDIRLSEVGAKRRLKGVKKWKKKIFDFFFDAAILHPL